MRLKSGDATLDDAEQMIGWRARSPAHERAFREAVRIWQAIGRGLVADRPVEQDQRERKVDDAFQK